MALHLPLWGAAGLQKRQEQRPQHTFPFFPSCSVLDLNAFERQNKAEGLGMVNEDGSGTAPLLGFPLPGTSSSFRTCPLLQYCSELPSSKTPPPQEHPEVLGWSIVAPSLTPLHSSRVLLPMVPTRGCPFCPVLFPTTTWTPPSTGPKSPSLVAVLSLMSLIRVNQISSLLCCDVSNLSALILASCLSTSTCPSLSSFFFPNAFTIISDSFPGFLLSPYRSVFLCVGCFFLHAYVFILDCESLDVFFCVCLLLSLSSLFSCFLLPSCWLPQSSTARTVIPLPIPLAVLLCHPNPQRPLHLGAEDLGHPGREEPFSGSLYPRKAFKIRVQKPRFRSQISH